MMRKSKKTELSIVPMTPTELAKLPGMLTKEFEYTGEQGLYEVYSIDGQPLVETETYKLAVAKNPKGQYGLVMFALSVAANTAISTHVRVLRTLQTIAAEIDATATSSGKTPPHYGAMFPTILEDLSGEDGRIGVFMGFHDTVASYKQLIPLVVATNIVRTDLQTGAWILGKLLKLLEFVHGLGFSIGLDASNILIETSLHGVFVLDFTQTNESPNPVDEENDIRAVAMSVWNACGGTSTSAPPVSPDNSNEVKMHSLLREIGADGQPVHLSAAAAMEIAYAEFDNIWPKVPNADNRGLKRQWHPYQTYPR